MHLLIRLRLLLLVPLVTFAAVLHAQQLSWAKQVQVQVDPVVGSGFCRARAVAALVDGGFLSAGEYFGTVVFGPGEPGQMVVTSTPFTSNCYVARYGPDGALQWVRLLHVDASHPNLQGSIEHTSLRGLAAAADGSFVICGTMFAPTTFGAGEAQQTTLSPFGDLDNGPWQYTMYVAMFAADGTLQWARRDAPGVWAGQQRVALASDGGIMVTGSFQTWEGPVTFGIGDPGEIALSDGYGGLRMFLARYEPSGVFARVSWVRTTVAEGAGSEGFAVDATPDGGCLVTGGCWFDSVSGSTPVAGFGEPTQTALTSVSTRGAAFVLKYNALGALVWARQFVQAAAPGFEAGSRGDCIAAGSDGSFALAGTFWGELTLGSGEPGQTSLSSAAAIDAPDQYVARFNVDGSLSWVRRIRGDGASHRVAGVDVLGDNAVLLLDDGASARTFDPDGATPVILPAGTLLAKYEPGGALAWAKAIASKPGDETSGGIAAFADGSCVLSAAVDPANATIGAGEPNETGLAPVRGLLIARLRGAVTTLTASTVPDGTSPVTVAPTSVAEAGRSDVTITFASVTSTGTTSAIVTAGAPTPPVPANFTLAGEPQWYEISSTASYTAPIEICIDYDENSVGDESLLRLLHHEAGAWVDVTTSLDTVVNRICGETTSLSPFTLALGPSIRITASHAVVSSFGGTTTLHVETDGTAPLLTTTAGTLVGSPVDQGDGRRFTVDLVADRNAAGATVTAWAGASSASTSIRFVPVDPMRSTVIVSPGLTYVNGVAEAAIVLRDDAGGIVSLPMPVVIASSAGVLQGAIAMPEPGTYTQSLIADRAGVTAQITATADGLLLNATAALTVLDPSVSAAIGIDALAAALPYATIQEAINHIVTHGLVRIVAAPRRHEEIVKLHGIENVVVEAFTGGVPCVVQGFRVDRCRRVTLAGFHVEAAATGASGLVFAGGQNGNDDVLVQSLVVRGTRGRHAGIAVGAHHGSLVVENCAVLGSAGNGVELARGGPFTIRGCAITGSAWNGVSIDEAAIVTIDTCTIGGNGTAGDQRRGYGVLRQRAPGGGTPQEVTLLGNVFFDNRGLVVVGRSDADLGNFDQIIDSSDQQSPY